MRRAGPSYTPPLAARPRNRFSSCSASELPNSSPIAIPTALHDPRRRPAGGPTGRAAGAAADRATAARPSRVRELRSAKRCASSSADGPPAPRHERAHLVEAGVDEVLGVVHAALALEPATGREHGAAHDARRPDVAEDAALVAQPVHEARLAEQLVELGAVLVGDLRADAGDVRVDIVGRRRSARRRTIGSRAAARRAARARSARRCRSRRAADSRRGRGTPTSRRRPRRPNARSSASVLPGSPSESSSARAAASSLIAAMSRCELAGRTRRHRRRAAHHRERVGRRDVGPRRRGARAGRRPASSPTPVKRMCW